MRDKNDEYLLCVCVPAYNRKRELASVIRAVLNTNRNDICIAITDNCSNDGTKEMIEQSHKKRVFYQLNDKPLPALLNNIRSLFNGVGKYCYFCNDRDIIYTDRLLRLIDFLENNAEFSFVRDSQNNGHNDDDFRIFERGFDSLIHQRCTHHPTGMIFNRKVLAENILPDTYGKYLDCIHTCSYLMRDVVKYGMSAVCNFGSWGQRSREYIRKHKSGTVINNALYFYPVVSINGARKTLKQISSGYKSKLTLKQRIEVQIYVLKFYCDNLSDYKKYLFDIYETEHYGIDRRFVSTAEMIKIFYRYYHLLYVYMIKNEFPKETLNRFEREKKILLANIIIQSLKCDYHFIRKIFYEK